MKKTLLLITTFLALMSSLSANNIDKWKGNSIVISDTKIVDNMEIKDITYKSTNDPKWKGNFITISEPETQNNMEIKDITYKSTNDPKWKGNFILITEVPKDVELIEADGILY